MKIIGLTLTNVYMVYRSIMMYVGIIIVISGISIWLSDIAGYSVPYVRGGGGQALAIRCTMLFMMFPVWDLSKIEAKSGYNKYMLTLPVSRSDIVKNNYFFYFLSILLAFLFSYGIVYIYTLLFQLSFDTNNVFEWIAADTAAMFLAGALIFPLLYNYGVEKSDIITLGSLFGAFAAINYVGVEIDYLMKRPPLSNFNLDLSTHLPLLLLLLSILVFLLSIFIATTIYRKKEF